jgi:hypothetical protein
MKPGKRYLTSEVTMPLLCRLSGTSKTPPVANLYFGYPAKNATNISKMRTQILSSFSKSLPLDTILKQFLTLDGQTLD